MGMKPSHDAVLGLIDLQFLLVDCGYIVKDERVVLETEIRTRLVEQCDIIVDVDVIHSPVSQQKAVYALVGDPRITFNGTGVLERVKIKFHIGHGVQEHPRDEFFGIFRHSDPKIVVFSRLY